MAKIKKIKLPGDNNGRDIFDVGSVRFDSDQQLTDEQKLLAKTNIGIDESSSLRVNDDGSVTLLFK